MFVILLNDQEDLKDVFHAQAYFNFIYDTHFVVIFNSELIDIQSAFNSRVLKHSHFLVALKPVSGSSGNFQVYRSNLQRIGNKIEYFEVLGENTSLSKKLFNEKLKGFNGAELYGYTTAYEPFVNINQDENGSKKFSGFDYEILETISKSIDAKPKILAEDYPAHYMGMTLNMTGL